MGVTMFNFVIIDDDKEIREIIESIINQLFDAVLEYTIKSYDRFTEFKKCESIKNQKNIFVLDIELNDEYDGIEIASIIRKEKCQNHEIIFLTGFVDYAFNVLNYKINPVAFIKKDNNFKELLQKALKEAVDKINLASEGKKITVKKGTIDIELKENDIIYAMKNKGAKSLNIVTELCNVETIETIENFLSRIGEEFIKIDRSTIVNYKNIQSIDVKRRTITMNNSETFYIDSKTIKRVMEFGNSYS